MADKDNDARAHRQTAEPDPDLEGLGKLVGTWVMCAEVWGAVDLRVDGGRLLPYPARRSRAVGRPEDHGYRGHWSRTAVRGQAERGDKEPLLLQHGRHHLLRLRARRGTLTIWTGERGSPAYYTGTFGADGDTLSGAWRYPGAAVTRRLPPGSGNRHPDGGPPVRCGTGIVATGDGDGSSGKGGGHGSPSAARS